MPLFFPSSAGINRSLFLSSKNVFSDGADTAIDFQGAVYDTLNNQGIIGGNGAFIGFMSDIQNGKIVQSAALPDSSGAAIVDCERVRINYNTLNNGEIMVSDAQILQAVAISADGGASWTDIGQNGRALPVRDVCSWRDNLLFLSGNSNNCELSADNGATFGAPFDIPLSGPSPSTQFLFTDPDQTVLIATSNTGISTLFNDDPTVSGDWNNFDATALPVTSGWNGVAVAGDISSACAVSATGRIVTTTDFINWTEIPQADNPLLNGSGPIINPPSTVVFVDALDGYFIFADNLDGIVMFISATDLTTVRSGSLLSDAVVTGIIWGISDGNDILIPANSNKVVTTLAE